MDQVTFDGLLSRQGELENNSLSMGGQRFRKRLDAARDKQVESTIGGARKLLVEVINPLEVAIQTMIDDATVTRGRSHAAVKWCELIGADVAAYMTAKTVLDGLSKRVLIRKAANSVAELIIDELRYRRFRTLAKGLFNYKINGFHTSNYAHMARSMDAALNAALCDECHAAGKTECPHLDMDDLEMSPSQRQLVGTKLIDLMITVNPLVQRDNTLIPSKTARSRCKTESCLIAAEGTQEWVTARNEALEFLWPVSLPMVVPPLPWSSKARGGYRYALRAKHPFVRGATKEQQRALGAADMPKVYEAINRIQDTSWKINADVLALLAEISRVGGGFAGVPLTEPEVMPAKPFDIATNEVARKDWRKRAAPVKERNHERKLAARLHADVMDIAKLFQAETAIWFPANLDFRGRVYAISNYLNPQGDDLSKGLLAFATGKALGGNGAVALATHGANCLGETPDGTKLSKATLQERVNWIVEHTNDLEAVAQEPLGNKWWTLADEPLQFYAFCCEWARYVKLARVGTGDSFVSFLACSIDGTANGLQHYSAMLLDVVGAEAVNVSPSERPQDIYAKVAERVLARLADACVDEPLARVWLASKLVNRALVKRPTMTLPYGAKKFGFRGQIIEEIMKDRTNRAKFNGTKDGKPCNLLPACANYMAGLIWDSLADVVVAATDGMAFMQKASRMVTKTGKCVEWTVQATGFPVRQGYVEMTKKQIKTILAGKTIQTSTYEPTNKPDSLKQQNSIAPNFVHSLDAAALMLTVCCSSDKGVESFHMIHDSYATHAADIETLAACTRDQFFGLYQTDVIGVFADQLRAQADSPEDFPVTPSKGLLDLTGVLTSTYLFS